MAKEKDPDKPSSASRRVEALRVQQEWCRVTLASIGDAVITTDTQSRVTFLNPVAELLTGWTLQDAIGHHIASVFRIVNQDTRHEVEDPSVRALRDGVIVGLANHTLLISKDGTERPIDDSAAPIRNDRGEVAGVVLVFRDISERYRQDLALQDALHYAENIIATLREPFVVLDEDLRVRTANQAFYQTFHLEREQTEGQMIYELDDGQWGISRLRSALDEVLSNHHPIHDFVVEHDFAATGRKMMLLNARRLSSNDHQPDMVLLAISDITEQKRAQHAVETSEIRYRRLFESAKDGILILDAESGRILDANPFMSNLLGRSLDDFMGRELWEIGLFEDKAQNKSAFEDLKQYGYVRYDHLPLRTKEGEHVEVEFVSNVYNVDGRSVAQCNIRDITDRRKLELKTEEQAAALADLHRRKDEFLAMLSHELRNPLAPIANAVQLLRIQSDEAPLQRQARTIIERQLAQLTRLVDDLMEVSRITTGRVDLRLERVLANGIVERGVEAARPVIERHKHVLTVVLSPEPILLNADPSRLEQVLVNLLTNAAKYTNEGGRISVKVEQVGEECIIRVRDTGIGIAPELLPRVFDLFTQAERSLDRSLGGLGVGLALVQRLVELHRGKVEVVSALGKGSEFIVRLPLADDESSRRSREPGVSSRRSEPGESSRPESPSLKVLVVDDNVDAVESLVLLLEASGNHDVRTAYTGPDAVTTVIDYEPDVVLLDLGLPGLDGFEVAKRIRQHHAHRKPVLVAITGYGQESDRQRSVEAGFDHHLVKPAAFAQLKEILAAAKPR